MEAARLGLSEYHAVSSLSRMGPGPGLGPGLGLSSEPWLSAPLLSALPGFLAHPHAAYPSYLAPALVERPPTPPPAPPAPDPRTTSIAALRMKAKEHVDSISKGLQMV